MMKWGSMFDSDHSKDEDETILALQLAQLLLVYFTSLLRNIVQYCSANQPYVE